MFFRFVASVMLVVLVSMVGIGLEKQTLEMKRAVSRQYFQRDVLLEMHARLRLRVQELTAPSQLAVLEADSDRQAVSSQGSRNSRGSAAAVQLSVPNSAGSSPAPSRLPLLRWEHPARIPGR